MFLLRKLLTTHKRHYINNVKKYYKIKYYAPNIRTRPKSYIGRSRIKIKPSNLISFMVKLEFILKQAVY